MDQFEFDDDEYRDQLDPLLANFGAESQEFAARKAVMVQEICQQQFGSARDVSLLDVGCGPGVVASFMSPHLGKLTCVDASAELLDAARERYPEIDFQLVANGEPLPFEDGTFDAVFFSCVLHHVPVPEWESFVSEVSRVVRPGGLVICVEHNPWNPLTVHVVNNCPFDEGVTLLSAPKVGQLFRGAGLEIEQTFFHIFFPGSLKAFQPLEKGLAWCPAGGQHTVVGRRPAPSDRPIDWEASSQCESTCHRSLVLPLFNQAQGLEEAIEELHQEFEAAEESFELVLVDNGSVDETSEVISRLEERFPEVRSVRLEAHRGPGWGVLQGLAACRGEVVGYAHLEAGLEPTCVVGTFALYDHEDCQLAQARRSARRETLLGRLRSRFWNRFLSLGLGSRVEDVQGTPKVFARDQLPTLQLSSRDGFLSSEIWAKARAHGWTIAELSLVDRPSPTHRIRSGGSLLRAFRKALGWIWRYRTGRLGA